MLLFLTGNVAEYLFFSYVIYIGLSTAVQLNIVFRSDRMMMMIWRGNDNALKRNNNTDCLKL